MSTLLHSCDYIQRRIMCRGRECLLRAIMISEALGQLDKQGMVKSISFTRTQRKKDPLKEQGQIKSPIHVPSDPCTHTSTHFYLPQLQIILLYYEHIEILACLLYQNTRGTILHGILTIDIPSYTLLISQAFLNTVKLTVQINNHSISFLTASFPDIITLGEDF